MRYALELHGVTVRFGGITAVDDVDLQLLDGQVLGLIGPNGAGKSTLLDAISGFVAASGRIIMNKKDIGRWSPSKRSAHRLGRSFQDARLYPSLTVTEVLAIAFERHHRGQDPVSAALRLPWVTDAEMSIARKVGGLIELMGLDHYRDKFVSELSTGTRRIVDLGCIIAHGPEVLLLDEPSSGIAQKETEALGPVLRRVQEATGCSMIVVEHDMPLISWLADKLVALELGRVIAVDLPERVLTNEQVVTAYLGGNRAIIERSGPVGEPNGGRSPWAPEAQAPPPEAPPAEPTPGAPVVKRRRQPAATG